MVSVRHTKSHWVLRGDALRDDTAEGVSRTNDLAEFVAGVHSSAQVLCQNVGNLSLHERLHNADGVGLGALANTETVVEESGVVVLSRNIDVAVSWCKVL